MSNQSHRVAAEPVREANSVVLGEEKPSEQPVTEATKAKAEMKPTTSTKE